MSKRKNLMLPPEAGNASHDQPTPNAASMFYLVGGAFLFISVSWLLQTIVMAGGDAKGATVLWTLMAASIAGAGFSLVYAGYVARSQGPALR